MRSHLHTQLYHTTKSMNSGAHANFLKYEQLLYVLTGQYRTYGTQLCSKVCILVHQSQMVSVPNMLCGVTIVCTERGTAMRCIQIGR